MIHNYQSCADQLRSRSTVISLLPRDQISSSTKSYPWIDGFPCPNPRLGCIMRTDGVRERMYMPTGISPQGGEKQSQHTAAGTRCAPPGSALRPLIRKKHGASQHPVLAIIRTRDGLPCLPSWDNAMGQPPPPPWRPAAEGVAVDPRLHVPIFELGRNGGYWAAVHAGARLFGCLG